MNDFYAGLIAGSCGTLISYPFDVIKTFCQTDQKPKMIDTCKLIYNKFGYSGFFKGLMSPLTCRSLIKGVLFYSYESVGKFINIENKYLKQSVSGLFASFPASLIASPVELIKISNQKGVKFTNTLIKEGPMCLFKGLSNTIYREVPYNMIYFPLYDYCKDNKIPFAGGVAGTIPWIITYPIDVIKTRKQSPGDSLKYITVRELWSKGGMRAFYNGLTPTIFRAFPTHLITLHVYDYLRNKK